MRFRAQGAWAVLLGFAAVGAVAGLGVSYLVTPMWEAKAVLQCTPARIGSGDDGFRRAVQALERSKMDVESRRSLASLIVDPGLDLYREERRTRSVESVAETMRQNVQLAVMARPSKAGAAIFTVAFRYPDPKKAADTTIRLTDMFMASVQSPASPQDAVFYDTLDRPVLPRRPIFPKRESFIVAGGIAGLILAAATLIVRRRMFGQGPGLQPTTT